jgi:hypothetical protein
MKAELAVLAVTGFFIANTYYDGKYIAILKSWKKYYQMLAIAFTGLSAYLFLRKHPSETRTLLTSASGLIKHLPIDRDAGQLLSPIFDITKSASCQPFSSCQPFDKTNQTTQEQRIQTSGNKATKRCVSETKKKYVAAHQGWKCGKCNNQLSAWFEVDHKIRLESGGSNHVDNLVALCRECHGEKTGFENF